MKPRAGFVFCEFGPSSWTGPQWVSLAVYVILFLVAVWFAFRVARPPENRTDGDRD